MSWIPYLSMTALSVVGTLLILIILLQRGRGGGLAGALGGMGGQSALGTKAGDVFTRITVGLAIFWVILAATNVYALRLNGPMYAGGTDVVPTASALDDAKDETESLDLPESTTTSEDAKPASEPESKPAVEMPTDDKPKPAPEKEAPADAAEKPATEEPKSEATPEAPAKPETPAPAAETKPE